MKMRESVCLGPVVRSVEGHFRPRAASEVGPFVPQQRTCGDSTAMSVSCQERKFASRGRLVPNHIVPRKAFEQHP